MTTLRGLVIGASNKMKVHFYIYNSLLPIPIVCSPYTGKKLQPIVIEKLVLLSLLLENKKTLNFTLSMFTLSLRHYTLR